VHCVPHRRQPLVVFGCRGHPLAARAALRPHDLQGEAFVQREEGSRTRQIFDEGMAAFGVKVHTALEIGSREGVREAVAQGLGLGVVARPAFVPDPRLVLLPIEGLALHTHVHLICRRERRDAPLIAAFLNEASALGDGGGATPGEVALSRNGHRSS
jgi:LysR family transcriptional regulator, low CO2-responsive transcriptional regulator